MTARSAVPWPSIGLALFAGGAMIVAGASAWLALAVTVLWIGSLWLVRPEPMVTHLAADTDGRALHAMRDAIEPIGVPLLILDETRIVIANAAARAALGAHIGGQDARIALRHPDAMRLLDMPDDDGVTIPGFTGGRSRWQLDRRRIDGELWLIELHDRTAEADVSRAHTDFVANASHELRTPLAAIIGYVETLSDTANPVDADTARRFHEVVLREARRMQSLVTDLMSLSQVEAEKHDLPSTRVDLADLARRVVAEMATVVGRERIDLSICADAETAVAGDPGQLEQLLRNLVDNALKYGADDTPVRITVERQAGNTVVLTIADQGMGIAAEHIPHLTRRFYRTDPGRSRAAGGTGLGLAIVKHIVERHRARLDIASAVGEGTTAAVSFPALPPLS